MPEIAYFVTPHGFGHATRAAAVMAALQKRNPNIHIHIFTQAPERIFTETLPHTFTYHNLLTDLGLVQLTPLEADFPATIQRLNTFYPLDQTLIQKLAQQIQSCVCVCCDIAPLGIAVAQKANRPSVLIENFTWDWIYEPFVSDYPAFTPHITYLKDLFQSATHHIQTRPVCYPNAKATTVNPVSRDNRQPRQEIRQALGLSDTSKVVMITMGGVPFQYAGSDHLSQLTNTYFLLPNSGDTLRQEGNLIHLPRDSQLYHPDLVQASDLVISKIGYSTVAEVYQAGTPLGYIPRPEFRESAALQPFIETHMPSLSINNNDFESGKWLQSLSHLLALPRAQRTQPNGAHQIAEYLITNILS
jgi:UDP:flavonoid glycosyltransferase YjiC (YdhE family)